MTKPLTFVVLAAFIFALVGCASDPPRQTSGNGYAARSDSGTDYAPWMIPIRFFY